MAAATFLLMACGTFAGQPAPATPAATAAPGVGWATFLRDDCEWSAPVSAPATCFGHRGPGFQVRAVRREGSRWYVWDPSTNNFAYVDRNALSLPAELTAGDEPASPPGRSAVVCIDRSASYRYTRAASSAIGQWILDTAHPGDTFYLRWIEESSYRPEAEIVPAIRVPPEPTPAVLPATPLAANPFETTAVARATATVHAVETLAGAADATRAAEQHTARDDLALRVAQLAKVQPTPATASDAFGCTKKASELLAGFDGDRYLIIATNLEAAVPDDRPLKLDRVQLRMVYYQCDDPSRCDQLKTAWTGLAGSSNAASIQFSDPSEGLTKLESS